MSVFDRYSDRYYYETKFMDEDLPLWIWDSETNRQFQTYIFFKGTIVRGDTKEYANNLFKPAEWFTMESTPNYFVVDLYGISSGGYASYYNHVHKKSFGRKVYKDYYSAGGSGAVMFLSNIKIRIKDENTEGITYIMSGKRGPISPYGGSYDWSVAPANSYRNTDDWCIKLAEPAMTPKGLAPAGFKIIGMSAGGNAYVSGHTNYPGNGANVFYIPEQCAFPADIADLPLYEQGAHFVVGQWFNHEGTPHKTITEFTVSSWQTDSRYASAAKTYGDTVQFEANDWLYYEGDLYKAKKAFKGDYRNTILGFADYFLDKTDVSTKITNAGRNGGKVQDSPHSIPSVQPNRFFTESDINAVNELWVRQSLGWGASQGVGAGRRGYGGQGAGMVMIYKGESS